MPAVQHKSNSSAPPPRIQLPDNSRGNELPPHQFRGKSSAPTIKLPKDNEPLVDRDSPLRKNVREAAHLIATDYMNWLMPAGVNLHFVVQAIARKEDVSLVGQKLKEARQFVNHVPTVEEYCKRQFMDAHFEECIVALIGETKVTAINSASKALARLLTTTDIQSTRETIKKTYLHLRAECGLSTDETVADTLLDALNYISKVNPTFWSEVVRLSKL